MIIGTEGDQFVIAFEYDRKMVDAVRELPGRKFEPATKVWRVPLRQAAAVYEFGTEQGFPFTEEAEKVIADYHKKHPTIVETIALKNLDKAFGMRQLYHHQKSAVQFMVENQKVILADDMGLGKTLAALVAASHFNAPIHVICPASLKANWEREAAMAGVKLKAIHSWGKVPTPESLGIPYVLIVDEAHFAQGGYQTKRGKAFLLLAQEARAAFLLTGTPMKNGRPINLFPLLSAVNHPIVRNAKNFQMRYCAAKATPWSRWDCTGAAHLDELHDRIKDRMLRRTKKECLDLPEKTRVMRESELEEYAVQLYEETYAALKKRWKERVASGAVMGEAEVLAMLNALRQASSKGKIQTALELAGDIVEEGNSVVIYAAYVDTAKRIATAMGGLLLTGETPVRERQELVDAFQAGENKVIVCTFGAGGLGITLTRAQDVILVDRPWTPGDTVQAEDRLHRIGQKSAVTCYWIQWPLGDIDKAIDDLLDEKQERIELVLAGKRKTLRGLTTANQIARAVVGKILAE